jgi:hypothetical protein
MEKRIRLKERDAIIQSLRSGVTPKIGIQHIQVGRSNEVKALYKDIERISQGGAVFRLIIGDYGSGKTFFLSVVRSIALENKLVTVNLSPDRRVHASSGQARNLYSELMRNLATRNKPDGNALASVVERFVTQARKEADEKNSDVSTVIHQKLTSLSELVGGYDFAKVINAYWNGHEQDNEELKSNAIPILRVLIAENELSNKSNIVDGLRLELVQSLAMIRLLIVNWFEPADTEQMHLSTFLHQILAVIAQWGSARPDQLYSLLCEQGSFKEITIEHFKQLLSHMGTVQLIQQLNSGELVLGIEGERLTNSYTFYAVFKTPEEFRIVAGSKTLGALPVNSLVIKGQHIIFGGRRWKVTDIDDEKKVIYVTSTKGGKPPKFNGNGSGMSIHDRVRQEMLNIYRTGDYRIEVGNQKIDFVDNTGSQLFQEGAYLC